MVEKNKNCKGTLRNRSRDTRHRQKRTKSDLTCVIHCFVTKDLGSHLGGAAITTNQDITCNRASIGEPRYYLFEILCKRFKAMIEEYTIRIVSKYGIGQGDVKNAAMNLVIVGTKPLDIVVSRPDFDDLASVEMAYQGGFGGAGFFRHPFANTKKVECMHCVRCDGYSRADLL